MSKTVPAAPRVSKWSPIQVPSNANVAIHQCMDGKWLLVTQTKLESCKSTELTQAINFVSLYFLDALISFAFACQCSLLLDILCLFCFPYNGEQLIDYPIHK